MEKKYEMTDITKEYHGHILYRIRALRDFSNIHNGDLGGWIEKEENLSHDGDCWIYDDANVYGNAKVFDSAIVCDSAKVFGNARVYGNASIIDSAIIFGCAIICEDAIISGNAKVFGNAEVYNDAMVYGNANVDDNSCICGGAKIYGRAHVHGNAHIDMDAIICGNTYISGHSYIGESGYIDNSFSILSVGNIGSLRDTTTFYLTENKDIMADCGRFNGTIEAFTNAVNTTHKNNPRYLKEYIGAIEYAKSILSIKD